MRKFRGKFLKKRNTMVKPHGKAKNLNDLQELRYKPKAPEEIKTEDDKMILDIPGMEIGWEYEERQDGVSLRVKGKPENTSKS
jgi:hypothetical protein